MARGTKEGSILSPLLYLLVADEIVRELEMAGCGLRVQDRDGGWIFAGTDDFGYFGSSDEYEENARKRLKENRGKLHKEES